MRRSTFICIELYSEPTGIGFDVSAVLPYFVKSGRPALSAPSDETRVHVIAGEDVVTAVADIRNLRRESGGQGALIRDVERVQRALGPVRVYHVQAFCTQRRRIDDAARLESERKPGPADQSPASWSPAQSCWAGVNC